MTACPARSDQPCTDADRGDLDPGAVIVPGVCAYCGDQLPPPTPPADPDGPYHYRAVMRWLDADDVSEAVAVLVGRAADLHDLAAWARASAAWTADAFATPVEYCLTYHHAPVLGHGSSTISGTVRHDRPRHPFTTCGRLS